MSVEWRVQLDREEYNWCSEIETSEGRLERSHRDRRIFAATGGRGRSGER